MSRAGKLIVSAPLLGECISIFTDHSVTVMSCQFIVERDWYEVIAISDQFDEVEGGREIPEYFTLITKNDDGKYTIEFKK